MGEENNLDARIADLLKGLSLPRTRLETKVQKDFGCTLEELSVEQKRKVIAFLETLKTKRAVKVQEKNAEPVEAEIVREEDEEQFAFEDHGDGVLTCHNLLKGTKYQLEITKPSCECPDFQVNKTVTPFKLCKHLDAAKKQGYPVNIPVAAEKALVKVEKEKKRKKPKKEEVYSLSILAHEIQIPLQTPAEIIENEKEAIRMLTAILGDKPNYEDVIESFNSRGKKIEELAADVVISMGQYSGIRYVPLVYDEEKQKMNLAEIQYEAMDADKKEKYKGYLKFMSPVDVTTRCKITMVAAWKDKTGGLRVGIGTKEEVMTLYDLADVAKRGSNFITTKCESKAAKKAILNSLPVTHNGLVTKVKRVYGWQA